MIGIYIEFTSRMPDLLNNFSNKLNLISSHITSIINNQWIVYMNKWPYWVPSQLARPNRTLISGNLGNRIYKESNITVDKLKIN